LTGAEAEGSDVPAAVPMQNLTPQEPEAAQGAPEQMEEAAEEAAVATGGEEATVPPEAALEVIRSAPVTEAAASGRGGVELLADDLVDPAMVAKHLEAVRQAEQWMKVSSLLSSRSSVVEYSFNMCCLCRTSWRGPTGSLACCKASATRCSGLKCWKINS
jgi:hypothetical protein